jgi:hypothetical protein
MTIQTICIGAIGILFGLVAAFAGYRLFLLLLPIWGFIAGFVLGAQALQAIFGTGFLTNVTSWIVGLIVGIIFGALAYLFYILGVAILAGSIGYALGAGIVFAINPSWNLLAFLVGVVVAVVVAGLVIMLNIQKWIVILLTAIGGAGAVLVAVLVLLGQVSLSEIGQNGVLGRWEDNWMWFLAGLALAVAGFIVQARSTSQYSIEPPQSRV